ncbi:MAG: flagellar type III secretion system pore protein FliP [Deltaproteobacteria bacterium]|nr:flagellar type III secretion system pore protein FliP [Deltaproteobacteria bacterium]
MKKLTNIRVIYLVPVVLLLIPATSFAIPQINLSIGGEEGPSNLVEGMKILGLLTVISLAPAILMSMTSFMRIVIVFSFLRQAIGTQQVPPNQVMIGLSLFLTVFIMAPIAQKINNDAIEPYRQEQIGEEEAIAKGTAPLKEFMLAHTREKDLMLFYDISKTPLPNDRDDIVMKVLVPSFMISELKTAFEMGFMLFIPFIVLDIAIASLLMSMGMIMLPPALISLPLKLMLFVVVDGWNLIVGSIVRSFMVN